MYVNRLEASSSCCDLSACLVCARVEHRYLRYGTRPRHLIVGTATRFCDTGNDSDYGNHLNRLAVANKLDFVHLHGFELWVHDEPVRACVGHGAGTACVRACVCVCGFGE